MECFAADSDSLICDSQYDAEDRMLNFLRLDDLETSETGVSLFPWLLTDFFTLASAKGVMLPIVFGTDNLLGGFADLSLPESSRTLTLLLTLDTGFPLKSYTRHHDNLLLCKKQCGNETLVRIKLYALWYL